MSEIGSSNYYLVGYFKGIPVYEPLVPVFFGLNNPRSDRANAGPGKLVIGGGGGEHPAIVFHRLEYSVARLLCSEYRPMDAEPTEEIMRVAFPSDLSEFYQCILEYCDWDNGRHREFHQRCDFDYSRFKDDNLFEEYDDPENPNPPGMSFEEWLEMNIAEFVYVSMPTITPTISQWRETLGAPEYCWFNGVMLPPPGHPDYQNYCDSPRPKECGGICRWKVEDRWPGYHRNPDW